MVVPWHPGAGYVGRDMEDDDGFQASSPDRRGVSGGEMATERAPLGEVALDVVESLLEGCQVIGFDFRYLYVNEAVVRQAKTTRDALLGRTMTECFPGIDATPMYAALQRCMTSRAHDRM